jgi:hypothetical protein
MMCPCHVWVKPEPINVVKRVSCSPWTHHLTDARRVCYHLLHVNSLWFDSHGTRTHHLTDARRACYHLLHVYSLWFDYGSILSSRLLNDVFMSRVSKTRDYKRGEKGIMLSSRVLNDVFVSIYRLWFDSHVTWTHHLTDTRRAWYHLLHAYSLCLTHTAHEHMI